MYVPAIPILYPPPPVTLLNERIAPSSTLQTHTAELRVSANHTQQHDEGPELVQNWTLSEASSGQEVGLGRLKLAEKGVKRGVKRVSKRVSKGPKGPFLTFSGSQDLI